MTTELQIIPPKYQGGSIPKTSFIFRTTYPAGLGCLCNNRNSTFHTLSRWKAHCKGKRHVYWMESLYDDEPIDGNQRDLVLELKSHIRDLKKINVRLSNDISAYRLAITHQNAVIDSYRDMVRENEESDIDE